MAAEAQKYVTIGQIAGKMAHDFNNILCVVMGLSDLAILDCDCENDEVRNSLKLIFEQSVHGRNLTKNLVSFAKDQEAKQQYFNLGEFFG